MPTVVNRVKRQVEEDETFKGDIKDLLEGGQSFKDSVKGDTGATGPTGLTGSSGKDAKPEDVADVLVIEKATKLGKAVIGADSSNRHSLSSKITYWLKEH